MRRAGLAVLAVAMLGAPPLHAQAPAPNPQMAAAQASFEALAEAERKAIQNDLIWAGGFSGAISGSYGPLTFRAINTFKGGRGPADGILAPAERAALAKAAQTARDAAGFRLVADEKTGVRIGIPTKLLPKSSTTPSGSRWQSADEKVTLDTSASPPGDTLEALFEKAVAVTPNNPGRKITYKLLRPDFFVVTGETPTGRFYRRLSAGPQGLRGFSIGYDKALAAEVDKLVIAIAGSFDPFPTGPMPGPGTAAAGRAGPAPLTQPAQRSNERYGAALAVSPTVALSAAAAIDGCRSLSVAGRPAKLRLKDDASGLVLLDLEGRAAGNPPALRTGAPGADEALVLVAFGDDAGKRAAVALPGQSVQAGAKPAVSAPLQPGQAGAPAFDRQGRLVGLITANPSDRVLVAGVAPQRAHVIGDAAAIQAALGQAGLSLPAAAAGSELSTGAVVERVSGAVLSLVCGL
ncbi:serine protease [Bosea thiooxidans]